MTTRKTKQTKRVHSTRPRGRRPGPGGISGGATCLRLILLLLLLLPLLLPLLPLLLLLQIIIIMTIMIIALLIIPIILIITYGPITCLTYVFFNSGRYYRGNHFSKTTCLTHDFWRAMFCPYTFLQSSEAQRQGGGTPPPGWEGDLLVL